jgi:hypothetical protein
MLHACDSHLPLLLQLGYFLGAWLTAEALTLGQVARDSALFFRMGSITCQCILLDILSRTNLFVSSNPYLILL